MIKFSNRSGFTLIEMAIVLVIIGLLIAAIVGGKNLLETAKLNAAVADLKNIRSSYDKFREIYNAIPGDMVDALDVFGGTPGGSPNNNNGNGDQKIDSGGESMYAWYQMEYAGLYTKISHETANPAYSPIGVVYYTLIWEPAMGSIPAGNEIMFQGDGGERWLTGAQSSFIDIKLDDGNPLTGEIYSDTAGGPGAAGDDCLNGDGTYKTTDAAYCGLVYVIDRD